jgi:lipid II:glycine glycyltransferase (peptidoglycan interpeptide bridge formation enzyme)
MRSYIDSAGLKWIDKNNRTLYIDLTQSLETIRNNTKRTWRQNLNKAEKRGLTILEGTDIHLFDTVNRLFKETLLRKSFEPGINMEEYRTMQEELPENMKMKIMVCMYDGRPVAGLINSAIGETGIDLIAATGNDGLKLGGNHLLRWNMLEYLKDRGCHFYDLGGIDPKNNPGGYQFKSGFSGKNGYDVYFGKFEACENKFSMLAITLGDLFLVKYKKAKSVLHKWQNTFKI